MSEKILAIDDDNELLFLEKVILKREGFDVLTANSPDQGLMKALEERPDLILLDVMMPDIDGWEVCQRLREVSAAPIIFVTAKTEDQDIIAGLEAGADDYITKPFNNAELVARVKAVLRRTQTADGTLTFDQGNLQINLTRRSVSARGQEVSLTPKEFDLLAALAQHPNRPLPAVQLAALAWGPAAANDAARDNLKMHVHYLRRKIERDPDEPEYILNSRAGGYRFAAQAS